MDGISPANIGVRTYGSLARTHFLEFNQYLALGSANTETSNGRSSSRDAIALLTVLQLEEFSTNVYDELLRRKGDHREIWKDVSVLSVHNDFSPNRQQARQALASMPASTFHKLINDIHFELGRRFPEITETGIDSDISFLAFAYDDMLAYESSAVDLDRQLARSCFDNLSVSLAKPTTLRVHPQQNFGWLSDEQILAVSADICEDFLRRKQLYDDEVSTVRYRDEYPQHRNDAREIMATLSISRIEDLARDIWCELTERFLEFTEEPSAVSREHLRSVKIISPITFLPAEMLSLIFEFAQEGESIEDIRVAVVCSHVCQFWRNVAVHTASLWTHIDLRHTGCQIFAERSLILPIHVLIVDEGDELNFCKGAYYRRARPTWLHQHSSRVQIISLHGPRQTLESVTSCLATDLSALLELELKLTSRNHGRIFQLNAPNLRAHAPNLRRLKLCAVTIDLRECGDLTHLTLERVGVHAKELLALLGRSPGLHGLSLFNLTLERWHEVQHGWVVDLVHLRMLRLERIGTKAKENLMTHLHIPSSAPLFNGLQVVSRHTPGTRPLAIYSKSLRIW